MSKTSYHGHALTVTRYVIIVSVVVVADVVNISFTYHEARKADTSSEKVEERHLAEPRAVRVKENVNLWH